MDDKVEIMLPRPSVFEKHGKEIQIYEMGVGKEIGRLTYASAILSDVIEEYPETRDEINEVKELLNSVIRNIAEKKKIKIKEVV